MEISKSFEGKVGDFSIVNKINGHIWVGNSEYCIRHCLYSIRRSNIWYCERSYLNRQIHEFGIDNFEASLGKKIGSRTLQLTKQECYPFSVMGIYALYDVLNLKVYVGASYNIEERIRDHLIHKNKYKRGGVKLTILDTAYKNNFIKPIILEIVDSIDMLKDRELYWIDKLDAVNNGYNTIRQGFTKR